MAKYVLAGVGNVEFIDKSSGEMICTSKTLVSSGINFSVNAQDVRGGLANKLLAQYFTDSAMSLNMEDALFSLEYLALNAGGTISVGADVETTEQITVAVANKITVTETPKPFLSLGTIGWYKKSTEGDDAWTKITFVGDTATVNGLTVGETVCVKYMKEDASAEQFTVSSAFIPQQCYALLTLPLFKSGTDSKSYTSSSKVGEVQVEIPTFIFSGANELSLTSSGVANTSLNGNALATYDGNEGCDGDGYYGRLKQVTFNKDEFDGVKSIVVAESDIELAEGESQTIEVYALYGGVKAPRRIDNSKLTFVATGDSATVSEGVVTATSTTGTTTVEITVTSKPSLSAQAVVTVE